MVFYKMNYEDSKRRGDGKRKIAKRENK